MIKYEYTAYRELENKRKELKERGYVSSVWVSSHLGEFATLSAKRGILFNDMRKAVKISKSIEAVSLNIVGVSKMYYKLQDVQTVIKLAAYYRYELDMAAELRGERDV